MGTVDLENFNFHCHFNFANNVQPVFEMMQHAIPYLKAEEQGLSPSVVNVSSVIGKQAFAGCATYCASFSMMPC